MTIQTCGDNGLETVQFSQMGIRDALSNGHDEFFFYDDTRYIAYEPLERNSWYIFYAVPEDQVIARLDTVITTSIIILAVAAVAFVLFIVLIWQIGAKRRRDLERIAFVQNWTPDWDGRRDGARQNM